MSTGSELGAKTSKRVKLGLALGSAVLTLLVGELVARGLSLSERGLSAVAAWEAQQDDSLHDTPRMTVDKHWFREDEPGEEVFGEGSLRILFLGDSFTFGQGVPAQARFSDLIEAELNARLGERGDPRTVHVFNAGRPGTEPNRWIRFFRALAPLYRPHYTFAVFFLRDGASLPTSLVHNGRIIEKIEAEYRDLPLYHRSTLMRFLYDRLAWRDYDRWFADRVRKSYLGSESEQTQWRRQQGFLRDIQAESEQAGAPFRLVIFPFLMDLDDYAYDEVEAEIERFARSNGMPVVSLLPGFRGRREQSLWLAPNDQHPNEEGHRIAARTLLPFLLETVPELAQPR